MTLNKNLILESNFHTVELEKLHKMWNDNTVPDLEKEFEELTQSDKAVCFIKYVENTAVGFAQCQIRTDYVEGTETSPVGYLEGVFIVEPYRHNGYAMWID